MIIYIHILAFPLFCPLVCSLCTDVEVAAMKSTPKDEADESLFGKVYGFFKHVGHKIKDTFQAVYDWFG